MGGVVARKRPATGGPGRPARPRTGSLPEAALTEGTRLTYDEYCRTPETNLKRELYFGVVKEGAAFARHQLAVVQLVVACELFNRAHLRGVVGVAPTDVVLDRDRALVLQPDVFVVGPDRLGLVGQKLQGAPDLAIEVTSPSRRRYDRVLKHAVYRDYGVREFWVVDPAARSIEVISWLGDARDEVRERYHDGDTARSRLWPELAVPVIEVWGPFG